PRSREAEGSRARVPRDGPRQPRPQPGARPAARDPRRRARDGRAQRAVRGRAARAGLPGARGPRLEVPRLRRGTGFARDDLAARDAALPQALDARLRLPPAPRGRAREHDRVRDRLGRLRVQERSASRPARLAEAEARAVSLWLLAGGVVV